MVSEGLVDQIRNGKNRSKGDCKHRSIRTSDLKNPANRAFPILRFSRVDIHLNSFREIGEGRVLSIIYFFFAFFSNKPKSFPDVLIPYPTIGTSNRTDHFLSILIFGWETKIS